MCTPQLSRSEKHTSRCINSRLTTFFTVALFSFGPKLHSLGGIAPGSFKH